MNVNMLHNIKLKTNAIIPILSLISLRLEKVNNKRTNTQPQATNTKIHFFFVFETQLQFQWESKLFTYNAQAKRKIRRVLAEGQRVIAHTSEEKFDAFASEHF